MGASRGGGGRKIEKRVFGSVTEVRGELG